MVKVFFNIIIPLAAAATLLLILLDKIEKKVGNVMVAFLFGLFIVNFGYMGHKEKSMMGYISVFYMITGVIIVIINGWLLWGRL